MVRQTRPSLASSSWPKGSRQYRIPLVSFLLVRDPPLHLLCVCIHALEFFHGLLNGWMSQDATYLSSNLCSTCMASASYFANFYSNVLLAFISSVETSLIAVLLDIVTMCLALGARCFKQSKDQDFQLCRPHNYAVLAVYWPPRCN